MVVVCSGKGEGERHECRTACFYLMDSDATKGLYSADLKEVLDIRSGPGGGEEEMCQMDSGLVGSCRSRFKIRDSKLRDEVMVSRSDTGTDTDRSSSEARHCRLRQEGCTDSNVGDMGSHDESPSPPSRHCVHHHTALHAIPPLVHSAASRLWRSRTHVVRGEGLPC